MVQEQIYKKDINRVIDGVIKADSTAKLAEEITEFVITGEQIRLLPRLFDTLVPGSKANCVWISGDFGSGKSHLLKILSYVLENKLVIEGRPCADIFAEKANDDFELKGQIQKACKVPTESVLFNIQELHDGLGKNVNDPVLTIFLKVFNKKFGYDEKKPEIAEIERYYDNKGQYELLKSEYQKRHGESWEDARKSILLKLQKLAEVVADIEGIDKATAEKNLRAQINGFKMDIDGFVTIIKEHLALHILGDAFGLSGILGLAGFGLGYVSSKGAFDLLSYSMKLLVLNVFAPKYRQENFPKTYYDYKVLKDHEERKAVFPLLWISLIFLAVGVALVIIYSNLI